MTICLILTAAAQGAGADTDLIEVTRLSGSDRYETAISVSAAGWKSAGTVVLASGRNFPDALAGAPLAKAADAPILLAGGPADRVVARISELGASRVIILGGTGAVSEELSSAVSGLGIETVRISGRNRFATALSAASALAELTGGINRVFFAYAYDYPDALSVSTAAAILGAPILFMDSDGAIDPETADFLTTRGVSSAVIVGGTSRIGSEAEANLEALGISASRISGANRYLTNLAILEAYGDLFTSDTVCAASALNFPDALSISALAAGMGSPLLLLGENITEEQFRYLQSFKPSSAYVAGGKGAVSELVEYRLSDYMNAFTDHIVEYIYVGKTVSDLNLRRIPGKTSDKPIIEIPRNSTVDIKARQQIGEVWWYQVVYDDPISGESLEGWVSGTYLLVLQVELDPPQEPGTDTSIGVITAGSVRLRADATTDSDIVATLSKNTEVTVLREKDGMKVSDSYGTKWYQVSVNGKTGYVYNQFLTVKDTSGVSDPAFEAYLEEQGFPDSYRSALRALHEKYPGWTFVADHVSDSWAVSVQNQYVFGSMLPSSWGGTKAVSLIYDTNSSPAPASWKSTDPEAYNPETGKWVKNWDGSSWAIASKDIIKYYMDPRNFLNSTDIFQFLDLNYSGGLDAAGVSAAAAEIGAKWLSYSYPTRTASQATDTDSEKGRYHITEEGEFYHLTDKTYINYPQTIADAGSKFGINPIAINCIITQELGTSPINDYKVTLEDKITTIKSRPQIHGLIPGYEGYYNYFNIGAYVDSAYSTAWSRGLHIAKLSKNNWNTREAAIEGGAKYFATEYLQRNQATVYYKRYNVVNGTNSHQFSTDTQGPYGEGRMLAKAYTEALRGSCALTFRIPVYTGMPSNACAMP